MIERITKIVERRAVWLPLIALYGVELLDELICGLQGAVGAGVGADCFDRWSAKDGGQ